jgi:uncharacterized protein (TIGR03545 family)
MTDTNKEIKKKKKKGPIRFEAIIPVAILSIITFVYFSFYFDYHMKKVIEYVGTQANGAEVNVDGIRTSFITGTFDLDRLQVTDPERPTHNSIEIGNMHFQYLWDALLRMKFVVQDASINNIQLVKPRKSPGKVLPPEPAKPSKLNELQNEVMAQVKNKYGGNMLGDVMALVEGGDYKDQVQKIRETLKSEVRVQSMISDVNDKKAFWDAKINKLSDTSKLKEVEATIESVQKEKNVLQQAQAVKKLTDLLKDVQDQYKEIETSTKKLQSEVKNITNYPKELQQLINEDIASIKNRFSIPEIDFKDMAMHLFAGEFAQYIAKARKYQALAQQYLPEKKDKEVVVPPKRSEGKNYQFPITTGYPLFWLKKASISSHGTADSYSGKVSGELTNVTTSPKQIKKPVILDVKGDFPDAKIMGVKALLTADFTKAIGRQTALIQVNSFNVPQKLFINNEKMKFGFKNAIGATTINATLEEKNIKMNWNSALTKPEFLVETSSKVAKEMFNNVLNSIPIINIDGSASGTFKKLKMSITSNLGTELGQGFKREIGAKVTEAQSKINSLVEDRIQKPKEQLMSAIGGNTKNLNELSNIQDLYKKNEERIKAEIAKLKSGGGTEDLKEKGKKLFKKIKF